MVLLVQVSEEGLTTRRKSTGYAEHGEGEDSDALERKYVLILVNEVNGRNFLLDKII